MNQQQRKFLIDKIEKQAKDTIRELERAKPERPSASNYLLAAVMSGEFELQSNDHIKEAVKKKAFNATSKDSWMEGNRAFGGGSGITFSIKDIFVIPDEYQRRFDEWKAEIKRIDDDIFKIRTQSEGLCTRIQLASNKTLERMINEVDDMGDISLMDTKIREIASTDTGSKLLEM